MEEPFVLRDKIEKEPVGETGNQRIARRAIPVLVTVFIIAVAAFFLSG